MGEYTHAIDAKGRVILPAGFRNEMGASFVITKGLDTCLFLYSQQEWKALSDNLQKLSIAKPEARAVVRFFFSGARTLECDRQGRFLIPVNLRDYAQIIKDVVIIGVSNRIEVWGKETWAKYNDEITPSMADIASTLADLGI
jgi:MraZ protein